MYSQFEKFATPAARTGSNDRSTGFWTVRIPENKKDPPRRNVARKRDRYYAEIYEGLDPVTGKEHRSWHPGGTDRAEAEAIVARLAAERDGRNDEHPGHANVAFTMHAYQYLLPGMRAAAARQFASLLAAHTR